MSGIARSALAVLSPVNIGAGEQLLAALDALGEAQRGPFAQVPGTHFGRFAFVPALTGAHRHALPSEGSFLLMSADFDTDPADWTRALCTRAGKQLDSVMMHCRGFPGSADPAAVDEYFVAHNAAAGFTVAGYRPARVEEVRAALRLKQGLRDLAVGAQAQKLSGVELKRAWREALGR